MSWVLLKYLIHFRVNSSEIGFLDTNRINKPYEQRHAIVGGVVFPGAKETLLNEGIQAALGNKMINWAMTAIAKTIKSVVPKVYSQLQQVKSKEELMQLLGGKKTVAESHWDDLDDYNKEHAAKMAAANASKQGGLKSTGSGDWSDWQNTGSRTSTENASQQQDEPKAEGGIKSAIAKFTSMLKPSSSFLDTCDLLGKVLAALAAIVVFANLIGIMCGALFLILQHDRR